MPLLTGPGAVQGTLQNVVRGRFSIPGFVSKDAADLITRLLQTVRELRVEGSGSILEEGSGTVGHHNRGILGTIIESSDNRGIV